MAEPNDRKVELAKVVSRNPKVHSGDLVFSGTRVPVETLVHYLVGGSSIGEFLMDFPTVERWQVEKYLELSPAGLDNLRVHGTSPTR